MPPARNPANFEGMTRDQALDLLAEIRITADALPVEFTVGADAKEGLCLFGPAIDGEGEDAVLRLELGATVHIQRALANAPRYFRFLLWLYRLSREELRATQARLLKYEPPPLPAQQREKKSVAQFAGRLCNDPVFKQFLVECHGLPRQSDAKRAAVTLRFKLNIESRADLDKDPAAAARFWKLYEDFKLWKHMP